MSKGRKNEEVRIFYLCNGEVPYCGKHTCYKRENPPDEPCRHTTDVKYALNFQKNGYGGYWEKVTQPNAALRKKRKEVV